MRRTVVLVSAASVTVLAGAADAQPWTDGFDIYASGSNIIGQGGWSGWDDSPAVGAFVSDVLAQSPPHSLAATATTDVVQQFAGATDGVWIATGWSYIPSGSQGQHYFILLNTYVSGGKKNYSLDLLLDADTGWVSDADRPESRTVPIAYDTWVEVRVEVDLGSNIQRMFYNGTWLYAKSWTEGASGGGALNIAALDIYSNSGPVYWDDLSLLEGGATSVRAVTWGQIKSLYK